MQVQSPELDPQHCRNKIKQNRRTNKILEIRELMHFGAGGLSQVVVCLPSKPEAPSSNPNSPPTCTPPKKREKIMHSGLNQIVKRNNSSNNNNKINPFFLSKKKNTYHFPESKIKQLLGWPRRLHLFLMF
jgi:hypothetical protein